MRRVAIRIKWVVSQAIVGHREASGREGSTNRVAVMASSFVAGCGSAVVAIAQSAREGPNGAMRPS